MPRSVPELLSEVRGYTDGFKAGDDNSARAFRDLVSLLLGLTIAAPGHAPRLTYLKGGTRDQSILGGTPAPTDPLKLTDGRFLKITVFLHLAETENGRRLKVRDSSYQYQLDSDGRDWVFRYDYKRDPEHQYPPAHLHVRGALNSDALPIKLPLERIHFPTPRVSLEAVIRLLAEGFGVPCNEPPEVWRPVLAEAEHLFSEIAHQPISGPTGLLEGETAH